MTICDCPSCKAYRAQLGPNITPGFLYVLGAVASMFALATLLIFLTGCGYKLPPCVFDGTCLVTPTATATATVAPVATPTLEPTATATSAPTFAPTPTSRWVTRLRHVHGFAGCNPDLSGRTACRGDRTFWFEMPGTDVLSVADNCNATVARRNDPDGGMAWLQHCVRFDSAGTPCGGAPSCDADHMGCERVRVGCNGHSWDDPRGSKLSATGQIQCTDGDDHYGFTCSGTPGATYMLCARPYPDAHTEDGTPILVSGTGEYCVSGTF